MIFIGIFKIAGSFKRFALLSQKGQPLWNFVVRLGRIILEIFVNGILRICGTGGSFKKL
mgnify:CR=1 FL=1